jgi:hypothetical protein
MPSRAVSALLSLVEKDNNNNKTTSVVLLSFCLNKSLKQILCAARG